MDSRRGKTGTIDERLKRILILVGLVIVVGALYLWAQGRPRLVEPQVRIPVSEQANAQARKNKDAAAVVDVVQKMYYNAWMSEYALKNGGWKNVLPLLTDAYRERVRGDEAYQDAISVGSLAGTVRKVTLSKKDSSILGIDLRTRGKDKNTAYVLVSVKLGIDQEQAGDYYLVQQCIVRLTKVDGEWKIDEIGIIKSTQEPARLVE
jgi:hypothetical protein